jgi:hypothetical protein
VSDTQPYTPQTPVPSSHDIEFKAAELFDVCCSSSDQRGVKWKIEKEKSYITNAKPNSKRETIAGLNALSDWINVMIRDAVMLRRSGNLEIVSGSSLSLIENEERNMYKI